ncbi:MAG TPA: Asp23/Gls24 family envelope stress response protein [Sphingobacteriaceae bacterium]|nr:Asp23/Gls24 family envelope stress response protein [Sphingobacteriaceae bacterium]
MLENDELEIELEEEAGLAPAFPAPAAAEQGQVRISDEVVSTIASMAASEVDGVAGMSGGLVSGLTEMLGKRNPSRGVRVEVGERATIIDLYLMVDYGVRIPTVAQRVQEKVKQVVEDMTGLKVAAVNIHIQGVAFPSEERASGQ